MLLQGFNPYFRVKFGFIIDSTTICTLKFVDITQPEEEGSAIGVHFFDSM